PAATRVRCLSVMCVVKVMVPLDESTKYSSTTNGDIVALTRFCQQAQSRCSKSALRHKRNSGSRKLRAASAIYGGGSFMRTARARAFLVVVLLAASPARADFATFVIDELYSNA